jgi:transposase
MARRREKFVELAEARVNKTLKDLQLIGNLSNRSAYDFTESDVRKMFGALQKALDSAKSRFTRDGETGGGAFRL